MCPISTTPQPPARPDERGDESLEADDDATRDDDAEDARRRKRERRAEVPGTHERTRGADEAGPGALTPDERGDPDAQD